MKNSSILINTARGEVINEKDLLNILKNKSIRLGLDVIKNENKKINFSQKKTIKQNKNVLITPHVMINKIYRENR